MDEGFLHGEAVGCWGRPFERAEGVLYLSSALLYLTSRRARRRGRRVGSRPTASSFAARQRNQSAPRRGGISLPPSLEPPPCQIRSRAFGCLRPCCVRLGLCLMMLWARWVAVRRRVGFAPVPAGWVVSRGCAPSLAECCACPFQPSALSLLKKQKAGGTFFCPLPSYFLLLYQRSPVLR